MFKCPSAGAEERAANRLVSRQSHDAFRRERDKWRHLYQLKAWKKGLRVWKLNRNPICEEFERDGTPCRSAAEVVHHKEDHKGNMELFFDRENLLSLCKKHHDAITARRVNEAKGQA